MNKKSRRKSLLSVALGICTLLFVVQATVYRNLEKRKARFVSPIYQDITLIRLQRINRLTGDAIILGSSITERLMASTTTAVLGVPSSPFTAGLKLLEGTVHFPAGTTYILETNNIFRDIYQSVLDDANKWEFKLWRNSSHFSMAAKPTNLTLSCIYYFLNPESRQAHIVQPVEPISQPINLANTESPTQEELQKWSEILAGIDYIRRQGGKICFVQFPTRNATEFTDAFNKSKKLAKYLQIPVLDYNTKEWRERLTFSDSRHLDSRANSTAVLRETIARDAKACAK